MKENIKGLDGITKEDLIRFILEHKHGKSIENKKQQIEIPVSIFNTKLFPLEAITKYLKENQKKKINEIAKVLGKNPSAISLAYKKANLKKFNFKKTTLFIPLQKFRKNKNLSVLEIVVNHLRNNKLSLTEIAKILNRDVRTIWTVYNRVKNKQKIKGGKND